MSAYLCSDAQIRSFSQDVSRVNDFLLGAPSRGDCYLADFWDGLHFLLTGGSDAHALPLATLKMVAARVYPTRPWLFPEHAEGTFRELIFYFGRLYSVAVMASNEGRGLLFSRYEDW